MSEVNTSLPPVKIAFVIDDEVIDILHTDDRLAAIFLSNPEVLDVTGPDGEPTMGPGWKRDINGVFVAPVQPEIIEEEQPQL